MGKSRLTDDEIVTSSEEIESIINSWPLTQVDDDPNNDVLTPSQLVCGRKLNGKYFTYNKDVTDPAELRTLAQKVESTKDYFYKRFEKEYLLSLQEHCYNNNALVIKLIKGKYNLIGVVEPYVYQPSLSKCTHINQPLQLLVPFEVTQERIPDENEITDRTDHSIEKLVRPRLVAAQKRKHITKAYYR